MTRSGSTAAGVSEALFVGVAGSVSTAVAGTGAAVFVGSGDAGVLLMKVILSLSVVQISRCIEVCSPGGCGG